MMATQAEHEMWNAFDTRVKALFLLIYQMPTQLQIKALMCLEEKASSVKWNLFTRVINLVEVLNDSQRNGLNKVEHPREGSAQQRSYAQEGPNMTPPATTHSRETRRKQKHPAQVFTPCQRVECQDIIADDHPQEKRIRYTGLIQTEEDDDESSCNVFDSQTSDSQTSTADTQENSTQSFTHREYSSRAFEVRTSPHVPSECNMRSHSPIGERPVAKETEARLSPVAQSQENGKPTGIPGDESSQCRESHCQEPASLDHDLEMYLTASGPNDMDSMDTSWHDSYGDDGTKSPIERTSSPVADVDTRVHAHNSPRTHHRSSVETTAGLPSSVVESSAVSPSSTARVPGGLVYGKEESRQLDSVVQRLRKFKDLDGSGSRLQPTDSTMKVPSRQISSANIAHSSMESEASSNTVTGNTAECSTPTKPDVIVLPVNYASGDITAVVLDSDTYDATNDAMRAAQERSSERKRRGTYTRYSPRDRAEIAKYAAEYGNAAAIRQFSGRYPNLSDSTVRAFRNKYFSMSVEQGVEMTKGSRTLVEGAEISEIRSKKRGRPLLIGEELDAKIRSYLYSYVASGGKITITSIMTAAHTIIQQESPAMLAVNGGPLDINKSFAQSILNRILPPNSKRREGEDT